MSGGSTTRSRPTGKRPLKQNWNGIAKLSHSVNGFRPTPFRMADEQSIRRYRNWYAKLLRLYSKPYYLRFGEGMEQTFNDLMRERAKENRALFTFALWIFAETTAGIVRENVTFLLMRYKNIIRIAIVVACILMLPWLANAPWTLMDYVVGGALLFGT